jgi:hypothetical protein
MAPGAIVEFTTATAQRPHSISYALVLRPKSGGTPWVRFDNAHAVDAGRPGTQARRPGSLAPDGADEGRPYEFTTSMKLLDDFWREVKRTLDEKDIPHDL